MRALSTGNMDDENASLVVIYKGLNYDNRDNDEVKFLRGIKGAEHAAEVFGPSGVWVYNLLLDFLKFPEGAVSLGELLDSAIERKNAPDNKVKCLAEIRQVWQKLESKSYVSKPEAKASNKETSAQAGHDKAEEKLADKLKARLKKEYSKKNTLPRLFEEDLVEQEIESTYVNLMLIEREEEKDKSDTPKAGEGGKSAQEGKVYGSYEEIAAPKREIEVEAIFDKQKSEVNKVLIYGRAGIGKTTLCNYMSYKWSQNDLWKDKFDYVFWLPLRELNGGWHSGYERAELRDYPVECFIKHYCLNGSKKVELKELHEIIKNEKILILLDGYDEIASFHNRNHSAIKAVIDKAIDIKNPRAKVIMTSRPNAVGHGFKNKFDAEIENIGLKKEDVYKYIGKYKFKKPKKAEELDMLIRQNGHVEAIAQIPINLYLLCLVWDKHGIKNQKDMTVTGLYEEVVEWLMKRYLEKFKGKKLAELEYDGVEKGCVEESIPLEKIAYCGVKKKTAILGSEDCKESGVDWSQLGTLKALGILSGKGMEEATREYEFIHLTFQEYFAARHVVKLLGSKNLEEVKEAVTFLNESKYSRVYERVILFVSGLVVSEFEKRKRNIALKHFWNVLINGSIDLGYKKQMALIIRCLREGQCHREIPGLRELFYTISDSSQESAVFRGYLCISTFVLYECGMLRSKLDSKNKDEKIKTAELLSRFSIDSQKVRERSVEVLLEALKDNSHFVRVGALEALSKLGIVVHNKDDKVLNSLIEALKDKDAYVRPSAAVTLGSLKISNAKVMEQVKEVLLHASENDQEEHVRKHAEKALALLKIDHQSITPKDGTLRLPGNVEQLPKRSKVIFEKLIEGSHDMIRHLKLEDKETAIEVILALLEAIKGRDWDARKERAQMVLRLLRIENPEVIKAIVPVLLEDIKDQDPYVRGGASIGLSCLRIEDAETGKKIVLALLEDIKDQNPGVRENAENVLKSLRIEDPEVIKAIVPVLLENIKDKSSYVRGGASMGLSCLRIKDAETGEKIVLALLEAIKDPDSDVRRNAGAALKSLKIKNPKATEVVVSMLIEVLKENTEVTRLYAIEALGSINIGGADIPKAVPALIEALENKDGIVREHAVKALGSLKMMFPGMPMVVSALIETLKDESTVVREHAVKALGSLKMGDTDIPAAVLALIEALKDGDSKVRNEAFGGLTHLKIYDIETDKAAVLALIEALKNPSHDVRAKAAEVLKSLKIWNTETAGVIALALLEHLRDEDYDIRVQAADMLGALKIESQELAPKVADSLLEALKDTNVYVRESAMKAIRTLRVIEQKKEKNEMFVALLNALTDDDGEVGRGAASLLSLLDIKTLSITDTVVGDLLCILKNPECYIRASAASILGQVNTTQELRKRIAERLLAAVDDINEEVSNNAAMAFGSCGIDHLVRREMLFQALKDTNKSVRICAVNEFGRLGTCDVRESIVPRLLEACQDHDKEVNKIAVDWLIKLGKDNPDMEKALVRELLIALKNNDLHARKPAIKILTKLTIRSAETQIEVVRTLFDCLINGILPRDANTIKIIMLYIEQCAGSRIKIPFGIKYLPLLSLSVFQNGVVVLNGNGMALYSEGNKVEFEFDPIYKKLPLKVWEHFHKRIEKEGLPTEMLDSVRTGRKWIEIEGIDSEVDKVITNNLIGGLKMREIIARELELDPRVSAQDRDACIGDLLQVCQGLKQVSWLKEKYKGKENSPILVIAMQMADVITLKGLLKTNVPDIQDDELIKKCDNIIASIRPIIAKLYEKDIGTKFVDSAGNTLGHYAMKYWFGDVKSIITKGGLYQATNKCGATILHMAVYYDTVREVLAILPGGSLDCNVKASFGDFKFTPLELAIVLGKVEAISQLLVYTKMKAPATDLFDRNILKLAINFGNNAVLDYLLRSYEFEAGVVQDALNFACTVNNKGNLEAMRVVVQSFQKHTNCSLQWIGPLTGNTALHEVVAKEGMGNRRKEKIIEALLFQDPKLTSHTNRDGKFPSELAKGNPDILNYLNATHKGADHRLMHSKIGDAPITNLVFKGGGPRGIVFIGALKELEKIQKERDLCDIQRVAGTSAGAITAGLYAVGYNSAELEKDLASINMMDLLDNKDIDQILEIHRASGALGKIGKFVKNTTMSLGGFMYGVIRDIGMREGLCSGEKFEEIIGNLIRNRTGNPNFTLGHLREKIDKGVKGYKEFYAVTIDISGGKPRVIILSSKDRNHHGIRLVDAIRASMSIPMVFVPKVIEYYEYETGKLVKLKCIDGGVLWNYPVNIFDQAKFVDSVYEDSGLTFYNQYTLGFSIKDQVVTSQNLKANWSDNSHCLRGIVSALYNSEEIMSAHQKESIERRTIEIDALGVGLLDFDLKPEEVGAMIQEGSKTVQKAFDPRVNFELSYPIRVHTSIEKPLPWPSSTVAIVIGGAVVVAVGVGAYVYEDKIAEQTEGCNLF